VSTSTTPLAFATVRTLLGLSATGLRNLDATLAPTRDLAGRRWYEPSVVSELIAARAQRRSQP
jgi:hypothetical protein